MPTGIDCTGSATAPAPFENVTTTNNARAARNISLRMVLLCFSTTPRTRTNRLLRASWNCTHGMWVLTDCCANAPPTRACQTTSEVPVIAVSVRRDREEDLPLG